LKKNNKTPLVSVIINFYNGEKFLKESIDSVINQKYKNLEIILWDNHSSDKSSHIVKNYNDSRIKYFYSDINTTLYKARNLAF
jgi:glycosyltransferase involved in cell wall biosynthesis